MEKGQKRGEKGSRANRLLVVFLSFLMAILIILIGILASVPPVSKDALVHHLAIPKLYLKHGGIYEIPFMPFSYYPMNLNLLYLIPLSLGNDIVPKFIHFSFALLTAWLMFGYLSRRLNTKYALLGVILFLSIPIIVKLSITVYVDLGLLFFSTAALLLILKWLERGFSLKYLVLSAVFSGLGMGTKYNGLITFFLLSLFVPFMYSRYAQDEKGKFFKNIGYGLLFVVIGLLVFSPWLIRNYAWTNNPVFPLYDYWFNPPRDTVHKSIGVLAFRALTHRESWWQMALWPIRIFFQGQDGNPQYFDGQLNPFLLLFPFLAFYRIKKDSHTIKVEKTILLAFATLYLLFSFFSAVPRIRYISPVIPPLVLLSVYGIKNMLDLVKSRNCSKPRCMGIILALVIVSFSLFLNVVYVFKQYKEVDPFPFLTGRVSRDKYIDKYRIEYPVMRYVNEYLPRDAKILFIYMGNRGYYCEREYVFDYTYKKSTLSQLVKNSNNPESILEGLRKMGITHLLIRYDIFDRWVLTNFDQWERRILDTFFKKHVKLLYYRWGFGLSRLDDT